MVKMRGLASSAVFSVLLISLAHAWTITEMLPASGPMSGPRTTVTVRSVDLERVPAESLWNPYCKFGTILKPATFGRCTEVTRGLPDSTGNCFVCTAPAYTVEGPVPFSVSVLGDFSDAASATYTFYATPRIFSIHPRYGPNLGGTVIEVTGENFKDVGSLLTCSVGISQAQAIYVNSTKILCTAPRSDVIRKPSRVSVSLNNYDETFDPLDFWYYEPPVVSDLNPQRGPLTGGNPVLVAGNKLNPFGGLEDQISNANDTYCKFGDRIIKGVVNHNREMVCIAPPSDVVRSVVVEITLNAATDKFNTQDWTNNGVIYTYYSPPYVFDVFPSCGPVTGGTKVRIIGSGFRQTDGLTCQFGTRKGYIPDTTTIGAQFISSNEILCQTPPGLAPGPVEVSIAIDGADFSSSKIKFTYYGRPDILALEPSCGPIDGFTEVNVIGSNFVYTGPNMVYCRFGSIITNATVMSNSTIKCDSPRVVGMNVDFYDVSVTLNGENYHDGITQAAGRFTYYRQVAMSSITPDAGPSAGGTTVTVSGANFTSGTQACRPTCRFGIIEVPAAIESPSVLKCQSPRVQMPDDVPVQIAMNNQQFVGSGSSNLFQFYESPLITDFFPVSGPSDGNSTVVIRGTGFLALIGQSGTFRRIRCRFTDTTDNTKVFVTIASTVTNGKVLCPTPAYTPGGVVNVAITLNNQDYHQISGTYTFFTAPTVDSISPRFGQASRSQTITVTGTGFTCMDTDCTNLQCKFASISTSDSVIVVASRISDTEIHCDSPGISRPDIVTVEVTLNGADFTTSGNQYGYYNAFILSLDPSTGPWAGGSQIGLMGYGYVNTGNQLKCKFLDVTSQPLKCGGSATECVVSATFVSQNEVRCAAPAFSDLQYVSTGAGLDPTKPSVIVELSVVTGEWTNNKLVFTYFDQISIESITPRQGPAGGNSYVLISGNLVPSSRTDPHKHFTNVKCKFDTLESKGFYVQWDEDTNTTSVTRRAIACVTPAHVAGAVTVAVAVNGRDYTTSTVSYTYYDDILINSISPRCGPVEGTTKPVSIRGKNFAQGLTLNIGTFLVGLTPNQYINSTELRMILPAISTDATHGGNVFGEVTLNVNTTFSRRLPKLGDYTNSMVDYMFYNAPVIKNIVPHSGPVEGGSNIIVEGAFFGDYSFRGCKPTCTFGTVTVPAVVISTVRIMCVLPAQEPADLKVPLTVSLNNYEPSNAIDFQYFRKPVIDSIEPKAGPVEGGTRVILRGRNFVDTSGTSEFFCMFGSYKIPGIFISSEQIICISPSIVPREGSAVNGTGATLPVEVTFNNNDYTTFGFQFAYYEIVSMHPRSGPHVGGGVIKFRGSGFTNMAGMKCSLNSREVPATFVSWNEITCPVPAANINDIMSVEVSLNGVDYRSFDRGYYYYKQISVTSIAPLSGPSKGGMAVYIAGSDFRDDYRTAQVGCRFGSASDQDGGYWARGSVVSPTQMVCFAPRLPPGADNLPIRVALNDNDFIDIGVKYQAYDIIQIAPSSGPSNGGTKITLFGRGFRDNGKNNLKCRFGSGLSAKISDALFVSDTRVVCSAPPVELSSGQGLPFSKPMALSLLGTDREAYWTDALNYEYYEQPKITSIQPTTVTLNTPTTITVTAHNDYPFHDNPAEAPQAGGAYDYQAGMTCSFGELGATKATYVNPTTVTCPTPKIRPEQYTGVSTLKVRVEVAQNGQDYTAGNQYRDSSSDYLTANIDHSATTNVGTASVVGPVLGSIFGLALLGGIGYFLYKRRMNAFASRRLVEEPLNNNRNGIALANAPPVNAYRPNALPNQYGPPPSVFGQAPGYRV